MGLRHVEREGVASDSAGLLVPAKPAVSDAVTEERLVYAVGVVTVVETLVTLLAVLNLLHLCEHRHKLRAEPLLISVEPEKDEIVNERS